MKIAFVGNFGQPFGTSPNYNLRLYMQLQSLSLHKHHALVCMKENREACLTLNSSIEIIKDHVQSYALAAAYINSNFDICLINWFPEHYGGPYGAYIMGLLNTLTIPCLIIHQQIGFEVSKAKMALQQRIADLCDQNIVYTQDEALTLKKLYAIPSYKITTIHADNMSGLLLDNPNTQAKSSKVNQETSSESLKHIASKILTLSWLHYDENFISCHFPKENKA